MRAFIVRPFGRKASVDFDRVEAELIAPVLSRAAISGSTTGEMLEGGNIRVDMFESLLMADLVIADVSIHNGNVFYELGIRHALRSKMTILIRARGMNEMPFDLVTDRYLEYDGGNPAGAVEDLFKVLGQTRTGDRVDSPVFQCLPDLLEQDRARLTPVPGDFQVQVQRMAAERRPGMLGLLGWEAHGFAWENEGQRLVGRELFKLKAFSQAQTTWSEIRNFEPLDREANLMLATIFQRLGDLSSSDQALQRVLRNPTCTPSDRSEAHALIARNDKSRWQSSWLNLAPEERRRQALRSPFLLNSYKTYRDAFVQNLNHFYSGLNALSLLVIILELAKSQTNAWGESFESDADSEAALARLQRARGDLTGAVGLALEGARAQLPEGGRDIWLDISDADFRFLSSQRDSVAAAAYARVFAQASSFHVDSARGQLQLFDSLSVLTERVQACLAVFPPAEGLERRAVPGLRRAVVFTGHRIDSPGRPVPRFPASKEGAARAAIERVLAEIAGPVRGGVVGVAGAASGSDILFHEVCAQLGVPTLVRLALPPAVYLERSVANGGEGWVRRFNEIVDKGNVQTLGDSETLPRWLQRKGGYDIWQRNNIWILQEALALSAEETILVVLWDGKAGDGPGGTSHMVELARERGVRTFILNTAELFQT